MSLENLTERITIRFTESELKELEKLSAQDHERKVSAFLRRILVAYLKNQEKNTVQSTIKEIDPSLELIRPKRQGPPLRPGDTATQKGKVRVIR